MRFSPKNLTYVKTLTNKEEQSRVAKEVNREKAGTLVASSMEVEEFWRARKVNNAAREGDRDSYQDHASGNGFFL